MSALPIPGFSSVAEVFRPQENLAVLIAPDLKAGSAGACTVIKIDLRKGTAVCIGRELPLGMAREVARRARKP